MVISEGDENNDDVANQHAVRLDARIADLLPAGWFPLGFVVSLKALDDEGDIGIISARTSEISSWEATGMLKFAMDDLITGARTPPRPGDEDDE